ncbi:MAG TPA: nitrous oxide reductase accessory protein NosL [Pseudochrobactrum sp.]|nr:nitrous oxide reductase accessory protein NosL [Pseudochrobactrum sp.]
MRLISLFIPLAMSLAVSACSPEKQAEAPAPFALTEAAMGRYCGMNVLEHAGPKGQVILHPASEAIWFSSARDTLAFTMLPEEPKNIAAIYVSDMAKAPNWEQPGAQNWVDAKQAFYVINSNATGGMGAKETVPFSTREAAENFSKDKGGTIVTFAEIPQDYVLGTSDTPAEAKPAMSPHH